MIRQISKTRLYVMLNPSSVRLPTKLLFPVLAWKFSPTNTGKGDSFFACTFSLLFLFTLLKWIRNAILMDILCWLVDKLWSPSSNIILINFISFSGTDWTCLSIDTLHQNIPLSQTFSSSLSLLFWRKLDCALYLTTYTQHKVPFQLYHQ